MNQPRLCIYCADHPPAWGQSLCEACLEQMNGERPEGPIAAYVKYGLAGMEASLESHRRFEDFLEARARS